MSFLTNKVLAFVESDFELLELELAEDRSLTRSGGFLFGGVGKWEVVFRGKSQDSVDSEGEVDGSDGSWDGRHFFLKALSFLGQFKVCFDYLIE